MGFTWTWKEWVMLAEFVLFVGYGIYEYHAGAKTALASANVASLTEASTVKEKQDVVKNNRPADAVSISRLHSGKF